MWEAVYGDEMKLRVLLPEERFFYVIRQCLGTNRASGSCFDCNRILINLFCRRLIMNLLMEAYRRTVESVLWRSQKC